MHQRYIILSKQAVRIRQLYEDFEADMMYHGEAFVAEMDTVKGRRERGKRLLTMIFRWNSIMLMFLMPDGTAASVKRVFDYLEAGLGTECFRRLFGVILTDNGGEFKKVDELELNDDLEYRTKIYYCDPMASWQKPVYREKSRIHTLCDSKETKFESVYAGRYDTANESYQQHKTSGTRE